MSRSAVGIQMLPPSVTAALRKLGEELALARMRRKETQRTWAKRIGVSVPTLIRMEKGDPRVALGVYATALWMIGRTQAIADLADPKADRGALELDIRDALRRRRTRGTGPSSERPR